MPNTGNVMNKANSLLDMLLAVATQAIKYFYNTYKEAVSCYCLHKKNKFFISQE
jgi:hypothetical protein